VTRLAIIILVACGHRSPRPVAAPQPIAQQQLAWLLEVMAHGGVVDESTIALHFDAAFLAKRPASALTKAFVELAGHLRGMTVTRVSSADPSHIVLHGSVPALKFALSLEVTATGRITMLDVATELEPAPRTIAEAIERLRMLAPKAQLLVAELDHGACVPMHALNPDDELALGSTFKLYVLLGLVDRIVAGHASWDQEVTVRDDWRSLPGGITQDEPVGTKLTVRTLAERMISISDNTAADYLLYLVGRERVEQAVRESNHANPALDVPFLGTRELFWLKMAMPADEVDHYLALAPEPRRAFLDGLAGKHPPADRADDWKAPRYIDRIEWFASSTDLCHLAGKLWERAQTEVGAPLLDVLAKNPAMTPSRAWSYIGFKGGSEPGVMNGTWILRRADGRWFVVTLGLNGPSPLDEGIVVGLAHGVIDVLATEPIR
jgi:hypothetical protein